MLIIFIQSITTFSQYKMLNIEYQIFYNTDMPNTQFANLFINEAKDESIYIKKTNIKTDKKVVKEVDNSILLKFNSKKNNSNYFNFKKDTLISTENLLGDDYIIIEKAPKLEWELIDETKIKDSITLSKAICEFRGRKYIAWYSLDFPIKYGPWKLQGLPGLIFEVFDETKRYNWFLKKISSEKLDESLFIVDNKDVKQIDIKEYSKIKYNKSIDDKLLTQMPRGTSIVSSEVFRNGLEIKFEWEE